MELDELIKRIEWLEKEHRKDRASISALQQTLVDTENAFELLKNQIKEISNDQSSARSVLSRLDLVDKQLAQNRTELNKSIEEQEKRRLKGEKEVLERARIESELTNRSIIELRQSVESFQDVRRGMQSRINEESRLTKLIVELEKKHKDHQFLLDEQAHILQNNDETRRTDLKKIADLQNDIQITRKKTDDLREKLELNFDTVQHLDHRINELLLTETERKQAQMNFIDQQNLQNIDRDNNWREALLRVEQYRKQSTDLDQKILDLEELERSIARAQDNFDDINSRFERRINELTEIQRINEERFRQEWIGLKSDDQKRWTNFTLLQDDANKTQSAQTDKIIERITVLEDLYQALKDVMDLTNETTEKHLQELMSWAHVFLNEIGRASGNQKSGL